MHHLECCRHLLSDIRLLYEPVVLKRVFDQLDLVIAVELVIIPLVSLIYDLFVASKSE